MSDTSANREELRRKLRQKIHGKRNTNQDLARNVRQDPQTALMNMGIDNIDLIKTAKDLTRNPHKILNKLKESLEEEASKQTKDEANNEANKEESEDEEAPPD